MDPAPVQRDVERDDVIPVRCALIRRDAFQCPTWGIGNTANRDVRENERVLERDVSKAISNMPFLWLSIEDDAGPQSLRGYVERNSIALLSNYHKAALDPPSPSWLGHHSHRERVRKSGLWNQNHVDELYDPMFLRELDQLVLETGSAWKESLGPFSSSSCSVNGRWLLAPSRARQ
jgi:hypothetical protein